MVEKSDNSCRKFIKQLVAQAAFPLLAGAGSLRKKQVLQLKKHISPDSKSRASQAVSGKVGSYKSKRPLLINNFFVY